MNASAASKTELEQARLEIARQSKLLAEMATEAKRARAEAEALTRFRSHALAAIGHELRTPLNAVIGFSEAMEHELHGPLGNDRYRAYANHIRESGEQLLRAAEAMLTRPHSEAHCPQDTCSSCREALGSAHPALSIRSPDLARTDTDG